MQIVAALYVESFDFRQVPGPSTRIDITGVYFSLPAPQFPATLEPHLLVLVRCPPGERGEGALEVVFRRDGDEVARNRQPFVVEPGKFGYRLVRSELEFAEPGTVEAHCTLEGGDETVVVPLTVLPPAETAVEIGG